MENRTFYHEILIDHNMHPAHKHPLAGAGLELEGVNPSCGDDIVLRLKIEDGRITDGAFEGRPPLRHFPENDPGPGLAGGNR